jgi:hypothetical protein
MAGKFGEPSAITINVVILAVYSGLVWIFMPNLHRLE